VAWVSYQPAACAIHFVSSPDHLLTIGAVTYLCLGLVVLQKVLEIPPGNEPCQILMVIQLFSKNEIITHTQSQNQNIILFQK
jgi:hypothetical protein